MKKSTVVAVLSLIVLLAVLSVSVKAVRASRSYLDCASRLAGKAPPGDRLPPESFHRLSRVLESKPEMYVSRVLANECTREIGTATYRFGRRLAALYRSGIDKLVPIITSSCFPSSGAPARFLAAEACCTLHQ